MKWLEIKMKHPNKFILLEDFEEEKVSENKTRILGGKVVNASTNLKDIMKTYQDYKLLGKDVIYSLPTTPEDFIIEDVPFMGILR